MNGEYVIEVEGLTAGYGAQVVLEEVSFRVRRGEIFVIVGGSGCGKSTLMKHMIGLLTPRAGRVRIDGQDLTHADAATRRAIQRRFGVLFQSGALFSSMTLGENVALPLQEHTDLPPSLIELIVRMKLSMVRLVPFADLLPAALSGGMRKRGALARAMALDPAILFFDEPSAGLDPVTSAELDALIRHINRSLGTTIVVVTHELPSIFAIADRVIMLDREARGIIAEGDPVSLRDHSTDPRVVAFFHRQPALPQERPSGLRGS